MYKMHIIIYNKSSADSIVSNKSINNYRSACTAISYIFLNDTNQYVKVWKVPLLRTILLLLLLSIGMSNVYMKNLIIIALPVTLCWAAPKLKIK